MGLLVVFAIATLDETDILPGHHNQFLTIDFDSRVGQIFFRGAKPDPLTDFHRVRDEAALLVKLAWADGQHLAGVGEFIHDYMENITLDPLNGPHDDSVTQRFQVHAFSFHAWVLVAARLLVPAGVPVPAAARSIDVRRTTFQPA
jgi:hypothetical protein